MRFKPTKHHTEPVQNYLWSHFYSFTLYFLSYNHKYKETGIQLTFKLTLMTSSKSFSDCLIKNESLVIPALFTAMVGICLYSYISKQNKVSFFKRQKDRISSVTDVNSNQNTRSKSVSAHILSKLITQKKEI